MTNPFTVPGDTVTNITWDNIASDDLDWELGGPLGNPITIDLDFVHMLEMNVMLRWEDTDEAGVYGACAIDSQIWIGDSRIFPATGTTLIPWTNNFTHRWVASSASPTLRLTAMTDGSSNPSSDLNINGGSYMEIIAHARGGPA